MRVLLIGCGAVGLSMATALYKANVDTELVARGRTAEAIRKDGIRRFGALGEVFIEPYKLRLFENIEDTKGSYDCVIISSKSTGNADITERLAKRKAELLGEKGRLIIFQNGYGTETAFLEAFDKHRIFHASFAIGFKRPQLNESEVTVMMSPVTIGSLYGDAIETMEVLAKALSEGGIPARTSAEIGKTIWAKLLYNCALNPLSAVLRTDYGGLIKSESSISIMNNIIDEVFEVMHSAGYETFWKDADTYRKDFYEKILPPTYSHHSSTLQDIENMRLTEIDSLNGAVVRLAESFNIDTPCNRIITNIVKSIEALYNGE